MALAARGHSDRDPRAPAPRRRYSRIPQELRDEIGRWFRTDEYARLSVGETDDRIVAGDGFQRANLDGLALGDLHDPQRAAVRRLGSTECWRQAETARQRKGVLVQPIVEVVVGSGAEGGDGRDAYAVGAGVREAESRDDHHADELFGAVSGNVVAYASQRLGRCLDCVAAAEPDFCGEPSSVGQFHYER